jgi:hypothetical protein
VTASSVASVKVDVKQLEQLARALGVPLPATGSGASLFRSCLDAALALEASFLRVRGEARDRIAQTNAGALEALSTFKRALGGTSETDVTEATRRATAPPSSC